MTREFIIRPDVDAVAAATADRLIAAGQEAIEQRGRFVLTLSGGSTPLAVCPLLVVPPRVRMLDWSKVHFFFGDERPVPADHPESNYNTARKALLDYLPGLRWEQVHRMLGEASDLEAAARAYEAQIGRTLGVRPPDFPVFDLVWLGMGPDGHTASLFPGTKALEETQRRVVPNWVPQLNSWRLTLTFPVLNAAREALFVVTRADKREAFEKIRAGSTELPAGLVNALRTTWIVDQACVSDPEPELETAGA